VSGVNKEYIVAELVVEQNTISSAGEKNGGGGRPSGSMTALCNMEKGDHAWIRTTAISTTHNIVRVVMISLINNHCFENQNGILIKNKVFISYHSIKHHMTVFFCKTNSK
jgi:hypothetical protein